MMYPLFVSCYSWRLTGQLTSVFSRDFDILVDVVDTDTH